MLLLDHDPGGGRPTNDTYRYFLQTAESDGWPPLRQLQIPADAALDELDAARARMMHRALMDAVDHAIALMDAIDARTEDLEPEAGYDLPEGDDERCASDQVDDEEEPDREDDGTAEPSLGSLDGRIDQTGWGGGGDSDREQEDEDDATAPERHGRGFVGRGQDDAEDDGLFATVLQSAFPWGAVHAE